MSIKDLADGTYNGYLHDYWVSKIDFKAGGSAYKLNLSFRLKEDPGTLVKFDSFILTKDGNPNKSVLGALKALNFKHSDLSMLGDDSALDTGTEVSLALERDERGYMKVKYVNALDQGPQRVGVDELKKALGSVPVFEENEELPF